MATASRLPVLKADYTCGSSGYKGWRAKWSENSFSRRQNECAVTKADLGTCDLSSGSVSQACMFMMFTKWCFVSYLCIQLGMFLHTLFLNINRFYYMHFSIIMNRIFMICAFQSRFIVIRVVQHLAGRVYWRFPVMQNTKPLIFIICTSNLIDVLR